MNPKGRCPSLISGTHSSPNKIVAAAKRTCKRCNGVINKGESCFTVTNPRGQDYRNYCFRCMLEVIQQSRIDLDGLERLIEESNGVSV